MSEEIQLTQPLVPLEKYLESGVHIGSKFKSGYMRKFIYKYRQDGICVFNIAQLDERIRIAANFLAQYEPKDILIVARRTYAQKPAKKLAECIGANVIIERFVPGTLTNPRNENFKNIKVIFAGDPPTDKQAIKESGKAKIPVISICDTSNLVKGMDLIIPANNKGKKALALIYWLLAREILKKRGMIKNNDEFKYKIEDFESKALEMIKNADKKEPSSER
ncbi:MAG: 30S ribosomal protein S2 [archaeon]